MIGYLAIGGPHEVDILTHGFLDLTAGIGIIHIGVDHHLQHHPWMIAGLSVFTIGFDEWLKIQMFNNSIDDPHRMALWD